MNKDNTPKAPKLRFKGFTGDWEQRKLGELGSTFTGLSGKCKDDFGHGKAKYIPYINIFLNEKIDLENLQSIEIDHKQNSVQYGDIFFTTSSETPEEVGMSSVLTEELNNTYLNSFCFGYRPSVKFNLNFIAFLLRSTSFRANIIFLAQGISRYNISKNKVMDIKISFPSIHEQNLISSYFNKLDNLLTLHQRKLETLKEIKKGLLQKIFSQELRFKDDDGSEFPEWEKLNLEECSILKNKRGTTSKSDYISTETIKANFLGVNKVEEDSSEIQGIEFLTNDILLSNIRPYLKKCWYANRNGCASSDVNVISATKIEQKKIANILTKFDKKIELEENKLAALKKIKKGLLQKMFI